MKLTIDAVHANYRSKEGSVTFSRDENDTFITVQLDKRTSDSEPQTLTVCVRNEDMSAIANNY